jgi:hypothetical protein
MLMSAGCSSSHSVWSDRDREGSLEESRYYLIFAKDLGYSETNEAMKSLEEVSRPLHAYSRALRRSGSELLVRSS